MAQEYTENPVIVRIDRTIGTPPVPGALVDIPVTIRSGNSQVDAFDLLIKYDAALTLLDVFPGAPVDSCGWEYFNYRMSGDLTCDNSMCPDGLLRVIAFAEVNNGNLHPSCMQFSDDQVLFTMRFQNSYDPAKNCMYSPIRFFWYHCTDNQVRLSDPETLLLSRHVYDFEAAALEPLDTNYSMADPSVTKLPTYFGHPEFCIEEQGQIQPETYRGVDFLNGGIDNICAGVPPINGDVNLNGEQWEIADAVLLLEYLAKGTEVFQINLYGQKAAADCNLDGNDYSIADFILIANVINGLVSPPDSGFRFPDQSTDYELENGRFSVDEPAAGLLLKVEGEITPVLIADQMKIQSEYHSDSNYTTIVVYSFEAERTFVGEVLSGIDGELIHGELAGPGGQPYRLQKLLPASFVLYQNYPNPFNPGTTIEFAIPGASDYRLTVTNAVGQVIDDLSGAAEAGIVRVDWDGSAYASGVYFYTVEIDGVKQTRKMMLLK